MPPAIIPASNLVDDSPDTPPDFSTETLMPQVYDALRRLATKKMQQEAPGQTISGTALLHEAYLRLNKEDTSVRWASQAMFFSAAAEAMRRILIERIRAKRSIKRGSGSEHVELEEARIEGTADDDQLLMINDALDVLADSDPESADLVKLRFFAGLTLDEVAETTGVTVRTVSRKWKYARGWLATYLESNG